VSLQIQHLLVGTDFSEPARWATDRAANLAAEQGARLTLVHVLNHDWMDALRGWFGQQGGWSERLMDDARNQLTQEAERVRAVWGVNASAQVLDGQPVVAIGQAAQAVGADMTVVGVRGSTPVHQLLVGTTAERLLRLATHPLLVVRQPVTGPYALALVPVDFSAWSQAALRWAETVASQAHVTLAHTYTVPFEEKLRFAGVDAATIDLYRDKARRDALAQLQLMAEGQSWAASRYSLCLREGDAAPAMVCEAQERACDLVVVGKHGRNAAEELLLGSVTKHVLAESPCDVLVSTGHAALNASSG